MATKSRTVHAADLFCGAGGTSTGMGRACRDLQLQLNLLAVNHWPIAIETHSANHPAAQHLCETLDSVSPRIVVPERLGVTELDLLVASPECTHHSRARGGRPVNDQSRASGWHVPRWAEATNAKRITLENVPEWEEWGPMKRLRDGSIVPDPKRKGETFKALMHALESLGYKVEWKTLCAADYGDPTTRKRLFVMATKGKRVEWPEPSHGKSNDSLFRDVKPWRAAKEVIDWQLQGQSIFGRKKPLSPKTMERIIAGLRKFGGAAMEPFIVVLRQHMDGRSLDAPLPTITGGGSHIGLAEPFLLHLTHGGRVHDTNDPFVTITGAHRGEMGIVQPFLLSQASGGAPRTTDEPMPTICADGATALVDAQFIVPNFGERPTQEPRTHSVDEPLPAITSHGAGCLVDASFIRSAGGPKVAARSVNEPLNTTPTRDHMAVAMPYLVTAGGPEGQGRNPKSVDDPLPTILTENRTAVVEPFITKYYGTGGAVSTSEPLDTITVRDRFGLCTPLAFRTADGGVVALDIRFRMLQPHELAAGMSFDKDYKFAGTKGDQIKQIGNAVPGELARALCRTQLQSLYGVDMRRKVA